MKNTLDAPAQGLPGAPDHGLVTDDPGLRDASVSGGPAPFPPTTPVMCTNGGAIGTIAIWTGTNVLGVSNYVPGQVTSMGNLSVTNQISFMHPSAGLQMNAFAGNGYGSVQTVGSFLLGCGGAGQIQFLQNGVQVWQINANGHLQPAVDNAVSVGLTSITGNNSVSPTYVSGYQFRPVSTRTTVNGSTSGSIIVTNPMGGSGNRKIIIQVQNLTGTATFAFPQTWSFVPGIFAPTTALAAAVTTLTTGSVTITGTGTTGVIILEGF